MKKILLYFCIMVPKKVNYERICRKSELCRNYGEGGLILK